MSISTKLNVIKTKVKIVVKILRPSDGFEVFLLSIIVGLLTKILTDLIFGW